MTPLTTEKYLTFLRETGGPVEVWAADEIDRLRAPLLEAIEDIESWAGYASEYFQDKHDLKGCVARYRAAVDVGGKPCA